MKIKAQHLADQIEVLQYKFNFKTIQELYDWLRERPKDEFEIKYK